MMTSLDELNRKGKASGSWGDIQRRVREEAQSVPEEGLQEWDHSLIWSTWKPTTVDVEWGGPSPAN